MSKALKHISQQLGYQFNDPELLSRALTHRSAGAKNNERLEFLGDGALNFIAAHALYCAREKVDEGALSRLRASLVCGKTLAEIGKVMNLGDYVTLGPGELKSGGFKRDSIIADTLEAILGAIYLDGGFDACREVVLRLLSSRLNNLPEAGTLKDPKTRLQEWLQGRGHELPEYNLIDSFGKDHARTFVVECRLPAQNVIVKAQSASRRKAEQAAAESALFKLSESS